MKRIMKHPKRILGLLSKKPRRLIKKAKYLIGKTADCAKRWYTKSPKEIVGSTITTFGQIVQAIARIVAAIIIFLAGCSAA